METLLAFTIAVAVTFYFVRGYVKGLSGGATPAAPAIRTAACPRCGGSVPEGEKFCGKCGAPLELWKVHRATVAEKKEGEPDAEKGAPRPVISASLCIGCGTLIFTKNKIKV